MASYDNLTSKITNYQKKDIIYDETYISYLNNIQKVKEAKTHFLDTGILLDSVRPIIGESWKRCIMNGFDPYNECIPKLTQTEFEEICQSNHSLLETSSNIINSICYSLNQINFIMLLTDSYGNILYINDSKFYSDGLTSGYLDLGAKWYEKNVGTNSVSLSLMHDCNITVNDAEHLCISHERASCSSAVIHDSHNKPIGTITITYYRKLDYNSLSTHKLISSMVFLAANLIEQNLVIDKNNDLLNAVFKKSTDGVIILDNNLNIVNVNQSFLKIIQTTEDDIYKANIHDLFDEFPIKDLLVNEDLENNHLELNETTLRYKKNSFSVNLDIFKIINSKKIDGIIIICRSIRDIIKLSRKFTEKTPAFNFQDIISQDNKMLTVLSNMKEVSKLDCPILIEGMSGTGKELCAQSIHNESDRRYGPFIAINCAALPMELIESELFGYEKGSFTGALTNGKPGKFELAENGTLFLDEIGELPLNMQSKLLRVLDNYKVCRIGGTIEKKVNIRMIAATNRNLKNEVENKHFRDDLYYRLNVMNFKLPLLKERKTDIPLLVKYFINLLNKNNPNHIKDYDNSLISALLNYDWPGNVRELQNAIYRAYYMSNNDLITANDIPESMRLSSENEMSKSIEDIIQSDTYKDIEHKIILETLKQCQGRAINAAIKLGIPKTTFYRKIKSYNINLDDFKY